MIVLDTNSFSSVLDPNSNDHIEFYHVLKWVIEHQFACFVFGGTKYKDELKKMTKYLKLLSEFKKTGKCVEINTQLIDNDTIRLKKICADSAFDDEHIVAILNISGCKLVCTKDTKAIPYILKEKNFILI